MRGIKFHHEDNLLDQPLITTITSYWQCQKISFKPFKQFKSFKPLTGTAAKTV